MLGLLTLGGYVGAVWIALLLSRETRKRLGAYGGGEAIRPAPAHRAAGKA